MYIYIYNISGGAHGHVGARGLPLAGTCTQTFVVIEGETAERNKKKLKKNSGGLRHSQNECVCVCAYCMWACVCVCAHTPYVYYT